MHELSIAQALIDQVQEEVERAGATGRVARLELAIGRLSGVYADALRFGFQMLVPGTRLEGVELSIEEPPAQCVCRSCGRRSPIEELVFDCPGCGSGQVSIEGGRELLLQAIELEDEPRPAGPPGG